MARMEGAYRLGKALVEELQALDGKLEVEGDRVVVDANNQTLVRTAVLEGTRKAGFIPLMLFLGQMLPTAPGDDPHL